MLKLSGKIIGWSIERHVIVIFHKCPISNHKHLSNKWPARNGLFFTHLIKSFELIFEFYCEVPMGVAA